jgi:transcriptional regulator with XRE-family HTH domain/tetratricopeptide (TPR) repeat protein
MDLPPAVHGERGRVARRARLRAGLTQEEVAERSGLSVRAVGNLERGVVARPRRHSLAAIADALGLTGEERAAFTGPASRPAPDDAPAGRTPAQLPPAGRPLAGRHAHLAALDAVLARDGVRVVVVHGGAGMGKTALALAWASAVRDRFPDGQLYAGLRGYAPAAPAGPGLVLHQFLRALHVPAAEISAELDARAALFRTVTAGRRLLLVLDDARDADQVWPLLPAEPGCLALVTSRSRLDGLAVRVGAEPVPVGPLAPDAATTLLGSIVGAARVAADPAAAEALLARCAGSPLAVTLVGLRAAAMPGVGLAEIAAGLDGSTAAFDLAPGDDSLSVRGALSWSYSALTGQQARMFRALAAHPGPAVHTDVAAALLGVPAADARALLDALAAVHLAEWLPGDRWRQHDLVRGYAAELHRRHALAGEAEAGDEDRLLAHYLATVDAATGALAPHERYRRPPLDVAADPPGFADEEAARRWLADELPAVVAVCGLAGRAGQADAALRLSNDLWSYLHYGALHDAALAVHADAARACRAAADRAGECHALNNLGIAQRRVGDFAGAADSLRAALRLADELADRVLLGRAVCNLGEVEAELGRLDEAHQHYAAYLRLAEADAEGHPQRYCGALLNMADLFDRSGRHAESAEFYQRAWQAAEPPECSAARGFAHVGLGGVARRLADPVMAEWHHRAALDIAERSANRTLECAARLDLGDLLLACGRLGEAGEVLERALEIARNAGERPGELRAHELLGVIHRG